jgi:hypothetical protein
MGYTHYWYRPKNLKAEPFKLFVEDCKKIFNYCENELGIKLANSLGDINSVPEAGTTGVFFNGSDEQPAGVWTTNKEISIPWPSPKASLTEVDADPIAEKVDGSWFAGDMVSQRVAPINNNSGKGSGSYESVCIERIKELSDWQKKEEKPKDGLYFDCCKTAYRPYDLAVTAVLISLKHHFPECRISSDGEEKDWLDGKFLCNNLLGYGLDFEIGD